MLVLSRKVGQKIVIDDRVTLTITKISGTRVSIGIVAPPGVKVRRDELEPLAEPAPVLNATEGQPTMPPVPSPTMMESTCEPLR